MNYLKLIILFVMLLNIMACEENDSPDSPYTYSIFLKIKAEGKNIFEYKQYSLENAGLRNSEDIDDAAIYEFTSYYYFDENNRFVMEEASAIPAGSMSSENPLIIDFGNGDTDSIWVVNDQSDKALFENYYFFTEYTEVYYNHELVETYDFRTISRDSLADFISRNICCPIGGNDDPVVIEVEKKLEVPE